MDIASLQFGADNYALSRSMNLSQSKSLLSALPEVDNAPISSSLMNQIQDSQLVSSRIINYYDSKVAESVQGTGLDHSSSSAGDARSQPESDEDIKTIVDEIIARSEALTSGTLLDLTG